MKNVVIILTILIGFTSCVEKQKTTPKPIVTESRYQDAYDDAVAESEIFASLAEKATDESVKLDYLRRAESELQRAMIIRDWSKQYGAPVVE